MNMNGIRKRETSLANGIYSVSLAKTQIENQTAIGE